jgi:hypothetical protein
VVADRSTLAHRCRKREASISLSRRTSCTLPPTAPPVPRPRRISSACTPPPTGCCTHPRPGSQDLDSGARLSCPRSVALIKVAARVTEIKTRIKVALPTCYPHHQSWALLAGRAAKLPT